MNKKSNSISDKVLDEINSGKIKMRPAIYFTFMFVGVVLAGVLTSAVMVYSSSILFFWFKIISSDRMAFGARRNLLETLSNFPWWILLALFVTIIFITYLVRNYGKIYRFSMVKIILIIVAVSIIGGLIISMTSIGGPNKRDVYDYRDYKRNSSWINSN
jgi:hypothetical protein